MIPGIYRTSYAPEMSMFEYGEMVKTMITTEKQSPLEKNLKPIQMYVMFFFLMNILAKHKRDNAPKDDVNRRQ